MKITIFALSLVCSLSIQAATLFGSFGTDGASLESLPSADSVAKARAIYNALKVKANNNAKLTKKIEAADGEFGCQKPGKGIHTATAGCEFAFEGEIIADNPLTLQMGKKLSRAIYDALPATSTTRIGANTKTVGNLKCVMAVYRGFPVTCTLTDVNALDVEVLERAARAAEAKSKK